jgi:hypothetical protein
MILNAYPGPFGCIDKSGTVSTAPAGVEVQATVVCDPSSSMVDPATGTTHFNVIVCGSVSFGPCEVKPIA